MRSSQLVLVAYTDGNHRNDVCKPELTARKSANLENGWLLGVGALAPSFIAAHHAFVVSATTATDIAALRTTNPRLVKGVNINGLITVPAVFKRDIV